MLTGSELYWILMLDNIRATAIGLIIGFTPTLIIATLIFMYCLCDETEYDRAPISVKRILLSLIIISSIGLILSVTTLTLVPNTKQMAMIKVIPMIANSEIMQELPSDTKELYRLGVNAAKDYLNGETHKNSKESNK